MIRRRLASAAAIAIVAFGLATTAFWLLGARERASLTPQEVPPLLLGLVAIALLTTLNLGIRWLRWHFLLRRWKYFIKTRDSLAMWLVSLPGIATPFYLGELARAAFLQGRFPRPFWAILGIWSIERLADVYVLGFSVFAVRGQGPVLVAVGAVTILSVWILRQVPHARLVRTLTNPLEMTVILLTTMAAWAIPALGLWWLLHAVGTPLRPADAVEAFGVGTLLGGFSGIPLGVGIAGSTMILGLEAKGVAPDTAALTVAVFRAGTVWYAVGLGLAAIALARRFFLPLLRPRSNADHFDEIAATYHENIPPHIVQRMLDRKIKAMETWLVPAASQKETRGIDVGCGQGWYVGEMAKRGFRMSGVDLSLQQLKQAKQNLLRKDLRVPLCVADAAALPYAAGSYEFAFGVNVVHHVADGGGRQASFEEALRILKPGGVYFLQEINSRNPLFRFYLGYIFPLLKDIDEGTEHWLDPERLPEVEGGTWRSEVAYFNFLPDFTPAPLMRLLTGLEGRLERSRFRRWSSHYVACLSKAAPAAGSSGPGVPEATRVARGGADAARQAQHD